MAKADQFGNEFEIEFKAIDGWLSRWKQRNCLQWKTEHGEKQDADQTSAAHYVANILPLLIKDYKPCDIFNADETGSRKTTRSIIKLVG